MGDLTLTISAKGGSSMTVPLLATISDSQGAIVRSAAVAARRAIKALYYADQLLFEDADDELARVFAANAEERDGHGLQ